MRQQNLELAGPSTVLRKFAIQFIADDHRESPAGAPGVGLVTECPWCFHMASPKSFRTYPSVGSLPTLRPAKKGQPADGNQTSLGKSASASDSPEKDTGELALGACSMLMQLFGPRGLHAPICYVP